MSAPHPQPGPPPPPPPHTAHPNPWAHSYWHPQTHNSHSYPQRPCFRGHRGGKLIWFVLGAGTTYLLLPRSNSHFVTVSRESQVPQSTQEVRDQQTHRGHLFNRGGWRCSTSAHSQPMMNPTQPQMERLPSQSALKEHTSDGSAENPPSNRSGQTQPSLIADLQKEFGPSSKGQSDLQQSIVVLQKQLKEIQLGLDRDGFPRV